MATTSSQGLTERQHLSTFLAGGWPEHLPDHNLRITILLKKIGVSVSQESGVWERSNWAVTGEKWAHLKGDVIQNKQHVTCVWILDPLFGWDARFRVHSEYFIQLVTKMRISLLRAGYSCALCCVIAIDKHRKKRCCLNFLRPEEPFHVLDKSPLAASRDE